MDKVKIDISDLGMIRRRLNKNETTLEELIDFIYELISENIRLEEKIEDIESVEKL